MGTTNSRSNAERYVAIHDGTQFQALSNEFRRFAVPATVTFVGWWIVTILFGAYAPGFFGQTVVGSLNVGTLFVMGTLVLVLVIAAMYLKFARTRLDPLADNVGAEAEGGPR